MITQLRYSNTNTYLIKGKDTFLLFDTGWAGTFPALCKAPGEKKVRLQDIGFIVISHFHPDHMGIAQQAADAAGAIILVADVQKDFIHSSDRIFERERNTDFIPVDDTRIKLISTQKSRELLTSLGINGELIHTPGHSDDSISLWLDKEKSLLVGDLNPLYELEMHKGTAIAESWDKLLKLGPKKVYYGHAKAADLGRSLFKRAVSADTDIHALVKRITRLVDKGVHIDVIAEKTGADKVFIQDVTRMYLTHPGVSVQGILDRIEIKGK